MAAPVGNQNAAKAKMWTSAIERALERRGDPAIDPDSPIQRSPKAKALDDLADKFIDAVSMPSNGMNGFKELGDRLEGKVALPITGGDGEPLFGPIVEAAEKLRGSLK
jgi:hypothetical protein